MHYWGFFPTGDEGTATCPVWGFATVVESRCAGVDVGERFYGYWPIADSLCRAARARERRRLLRRQRAPRELHLGLQPVHALQRRPGLPCAAAENYQALLRPLFITSFMIADFLADNTFFGARSS